MNGRISEKMLRNRVDHINRSKGFTGPLWTRVTDEAGNPRNKATVGMYCLDGAYGGWKLVKIENESGGISVQTSGGYVPKRELYNLIETFIRGMEQA